jgi:primosomal protein N' (replication factor Y)
VTVVGIVSADTSLYLPDFRTNERTFQLICQVAGRAGRAAKPGIVFIQTFLPDQPAIQFAAASDYSGFVAEELKHRKGCNLPPFSRLAALTARHEDLDTLQAACEVIRRRMDDVVCRLLLDVDVRGPMPAIIARMRRQHRMQVIVRSARAGDLRQLFAGLRETGPVRPAVRYYVDIDPVNLL